MVDYRIREYEDLDYETVRDLFSTGMSEYMPSVCMHVLKQSWVILLLMSTFCLLLLSSKSLLLPILAITLLLAAGRQLVGYIWSLYIEQCLREDLLNIRKTYMEGKNSCFWVVEAEGSIIGTVAVKLSEDKSEELLLKRMSVRRDYRGLGIAKALCRTVISFAHQHGCKSIVLNTLVVQHVAQKMYESVGFKKYLDFILPTFYGQLVNFTISKYRYDFPRLM
uniref:Probable N-acetyltransferase camello n=1 Tax=Geotrypetes seraphini TaxID=260995 RepID=A0A6P8RXV3_GEOSA|nr:probable N-acetyltransferase camello [Geotrypetes seraphini]XP_033809966.1 probable N-acetyltransferase camello [Geotrypetes seraphini]